MKKSIVTIAVAAIALGVLPAANASEDSEYEREGWAALEAAQASRIAVAGPASAGVSAVLASVWASDFNFVAPAP